MLSLTQTVGGASPGGMDVLLNRTTLEGLVDESVMPQQVSQHP